MNFDFSKLKKNDDYYFVITQYCCLEFNLVKYKNKSYWTYHENNSKFYYRLECEDITKAKGYKKWNLVTKI